MSVVVQDLVKTYGEQKAVNNVSFSAKQGEVLGFLGPNGAGKSTTMKIATCFLPLTSGSVKVCGFDVNESPLEVRKHIGYLPEHNPLYLDMYVKEYLRFIGSLHQLKGNKLSARIEEVVDLCGLGLEQHKKNGALSKGYRQRVGLAQSLIHNPDVLILDEPTTGLDPNQIVEIRKLIKTVSQDKTVIFSTHIMQEVQAICDRVIIINRGEVVANDSVTNLQSLQKAGNKIVLEFDKAIDTAPLEQLEHVSAVINKEGFEYQITIIGEEDIRAEVFQLAKSQNWNLLELRKEATSLESVFHQLTSNV